ncbi:MAG: alpha/beta hydrolase [Planctomycetota bacterium]
MSLRILRHRSEVLRGNLPGDPAERELWVYLPPGYAESGSRYPVLWCLTGFTGTGSMVVVGNRWAPGLAERMDRLVAGGCPPVIVAFPDCFTRWGGSQYLNSPALGRYEDYLCDELVPFLDGELRTIPEREARGVFGKSSGGYGAVRLAMVRPQVFSAFACHSGDMAFALCYLQSFPRCAASLAAAGGLEAWAQRLESREKRPSKEFDAINTVGMAAAYSPDPDAPFGFALPFDPATGEIRPEIWRRWREHDPVEMVERPECTEALRSMRLAFFDCGARDEFQLHLGQRLMVRKLRRLGIAHEAEEFDDDHRALGYRYDVSVPKLARALLPARAPR